MDVTRKTIEKLNPENYHQWSRKMKLVLMSKGTWSSVNDDVTESVGTTTENIAKFKRSRDSALADILLSVSNDCSTSVIDLEDAQQVWKILKAQLNSVSVVAVDSYLEQYQAIKMGSGESVIQYINRLTDVENKLAGIGKQLDRDQKRRALLRGFSDEYKSIADMIGELEKDRSSPIGMLVTKEINLNRKHGTSEGDSSALISKGYNGKKFMHCGRNGHTKPDCFDNPESSKYKPQKITPRKSGKGRRSNNKGSAKSHKSQESGEKSSKAEEVGTGYVSFIAKCLASKESNVQGLCDKWYVDSGATAHMSNNEPMFSNLEKSMSYRSVSVGNGKEASVSGIGLIRGKDAFDDACVPVQMKEALHIPDLWCNLISVSRLCKAGFAILFDTDKFGEGTCTLTRQGSSEIFLRHTNAVMGSMKLSYSPRNKNHQKRLGWPPNFLKKISKIGGTVGSAM